eukprot:gene25392-30661_t
MAIFGLSFILAVLSICLLSASRQSEISNPLFEASFIADVNRVAYLLSRINSDVMTAELPVLVDYADEKYNRTALLVCGLDPQHNNRSKLDRDCASIAHMLFLHNATMSWVDNNGWDALSMGATRGLVEYCRYLLTYHLNTNYTKNALAIDINRVDNNNRTALVKAILIGEVGVVELLLDHNADVGVQDSKGRSVLHLAVMIADSAHDSTNNESTPGTIEANGVNASTSLAILTAILDRRPGSVNALVDQDRRSALMYATLLNCIPVIEALLQKGADPSQQDRFGIAVYNMAQNDESRAILLEAVARKAEEEHLKWLQQSGDFLEIG